MGGVGLAGGGGVRRVRPDGCGGVGGDDQATSGGGAGAGGGVGLRRPLSRPGTPDGGVLFGSGRRGEEEWHTVGRRGRRAPSPAESEGQVQW